MQNETLPPQAVDIERDVLGCILLDRDAADAAFSRLVASDFYKGAHKTIFDVAHMVYEREQNVDQALVRQELSSRGELEAIGGAVYLADLVASFATSAHIESYCAIVKDASRKRQLIAAGTELVRAGFESGQPAAELLGHFSATIAAIEDGVLGGVQDSSISAVLADVFAVLDRGATPAWTTHLPEFDALTGGMVPGELCVITGLRGGGKSTLAANLARNWAGQGKPVLYVSYEMTRDMVAASILAAESRVAIRKDWIMSADQRRAVDAAAKAIQSLPFYIWDFSGGDSRRLSSLTAKARQYHRRHGVQAVIVDYAQLVWPDGQADTREQEVAATSRALKSLAVELKAVVVACSQLNDQGLTRESRALEHDADMLIHIQPVQETYQPQADTCIEVKKNRSGALGQVPVTWQRGWRTFESRMPDIDPGRDHSEPEGDT